MERLPIDEVLAAVCDAARGGAFVLVAPPGAGKTTRVPPALLPQVTGEIVVLEPRRVAARAAARRIAAERGEAVGQTVGYQVRFDRVIGPSTRIRVVTDGILLRKLVDDPLLDGIGAVLVDEVHERGLETDLALALLREVRDARPELVVGAMSATIDAGPLADWLGAQVITSAGRAHPVEVEHLPIPDPRRLDEVVADGIRRMLRDHDGDVLAFLPGVREIRWTRERLGAVPDVDLVDLYGDLAPEVQDRALVAGPRRRVVLATNVAETSVTVPGVRIVVDSGLARRPRRDPSTGIDHLDTVRISRASADQR
ncbi:MAG: helicase-related protein, partial [Myxococcota bacterium]